MRKKVVRKVSKVEQHFCGECALAKWVTEWQHMDVYNHKPICLTCPHSLHYVLRNQHACSYFVGRDKSNS